MLVIDLGLYWFQDYDKYEDTGIVAFSDSICASLTQKKQKVVLVLGHTLTEGVLDNFYKEARTTISLTNNENIVVCYGWMNPDGLPSLIFEYMSYGSLDKILESNHPRALQTSCLPKLSKVSSLKHTVVRRAFLTIFYSFMASQQVFGCKTYILGDSCGS